MEDKQALRRADELGMTAAELESALPELSPGIVDILCAALVRVEDALEDLKG